MRSRAAEGHSQEDSKAYRNGWGNRRSAGGRRARAEHGSRQAHNHVDMRRREYFNRHERHESNGDGYVSTLGEKGSECRGHHDRRHICPAHRNRKIYSRESWTREPHESWRSGTSSSELPKRAKASAAVDHGQRRERTKVTKRCFSSTSSGERESRENPHRRCTKRYEPDTDDDDGSRRRSCLLSRSQTRPYRQWIQVNRFDGITAWRPFAERFAFCAQSNGWNDREKAMQLQSCLRGMAAQLLCYG